MPPHRCNPPEGGRRPHLHPRPQDNRHRRCQWHRADSHHNRILPRARRNNRTQNWPRAHHIRRTHPQCQSTDRDPHKKPGLQRDRCRHRTSHRRRHPPRSSHHRPQGHPIVRHRTRNRPQATPHNHNHRWPQDHCTLRRRPRSPHMGPHRHKRRLRRHLQSKCLRTRQPHRPHCRRNRIPLPRCTRTNCCSQSKESPSLQSCKPMDRRTIGKTPIHKTHHLRWLALHSCKQIHPCIPEPHNLPEIRCKGLRHHKSHLHLHLQHKAHCMRQGHLSPRSRRTPPSNPRPGGNSHRSPIPPKGKRNFHCLPLPTGHSCKLWHPCSRMD